MTTHARNTARSSAYFSLGVAHHTTSRAIRAHNLNLAAYWRWQLSGRPTPRAIGLAVTSTFTDCRPVMGPDGLEVCGFLPR